MPPQLQTERLILRPFTEADCDDAYQVLEGHPDVWAFDPGHPRSREERATLIRRYAADNRQDGCGTLAVTLKDDGQLIGYVGLQLYVLPSEPLATAEVELYYKLGRAYWDQGYATEACREMLRFAFEYMRLARLVICPRRENRRSIRVLERLGSRFEQAPPKWAADVMAILDNDHLAPSAPTPRHS